MDPDDKVFIRRGLKTAHEQICEAKEAVIAVMSSLWDEYKKANDDENATKVNDEIEPFIYEFDETLNKAQDFLDSKKD